MRLWRCSAFFHPGPVLLARPASAIASFGRTASGEEVHSVTLACGGVRATILTYGAALQAFEIPDRDGRLADIVLGYSDMASYEVNPGYFGATVGRVANRIADGHFVLDGVAYQLERNHNGTSALHGGVSGFDKRIWEIVGLDERQVMLRHLSPDGDQGYPGTLEVSVTYSLSEDGTLTIDHRASTDRPTLVNMTNHSLFNMAGEGAAEGALGNLLTIDADAYTPIDGRLIPMGGLCPVDATAFDFRTPQPIASRIRDASDGQIRLARGYDHNFALNTEAGTLRKVARLADPMSGRSVDLLSDQPGLQLYTGNNLNGTAVGKSGCFYRQGDGIALEPQHFPDAPNHPAFAPIRLGPGEEYRNLLAYVTKESTSLPRV